MKRTNLWLIGATTAILTFTGLQLAFGQRYRHYRGDAYNQWRHPHCSCYNENEWNGRQHIPPQRRDSMNY